MNNRISARNFLNNFNTLSLVFVFIFNIIFPALLIVTTPATVEAATTNGKIFYMKIGNSGSSIFSMNPDGSNRTQINTNSNAISPAVSADGSKIAFANIQGEDNWILNIMNADGTNIVNTNIKLGMGPMGAFRWNDSGTKIFGFDLNVAEGFIINSDGTNKFYNGIDFNDSDDGPGIVFDYSANDSKIVVNANDATAINTMNADGSGLQKINSVNIAAYPEYTYDGKIVYIGSNSIVDPENSLSLYKNSSDGSNEQLVAALSNPSIPSAARNKPLVVLAGAEDGRTVTIVNYETNDLTTFDLTNMMEAGIDIRSDFMFPAWSPDGTKIAFALEIGNGDEYQNDIFTINADGSDFRNITNSPDENEYIYNSQAWAPAAGSVDDSDSDGTPNSIEDNGPNGGDANNDGVQDSIQPNVTLVQTIDNKPLALQLSDQCSISSATSNSENDNSVADPAYQYPEGFIGFVADCGTAGITADVKLYYYDVEQTDAVIRKYNPNTKAYFNLSGVYGAETVQKIIDNRTVSMISYQVTDGQDLDIDSLENGTIIDPVGIATSAINSPNTGFNQYWLLKLR